ncbi:MAG: hypothetical protein N2235_15970 [Fischerella sp.]|nr:hypothetical protein [Fischerella sp.]
MSMGRHGYLKRPHIEEARVRVRILLCPDFQCRRRGFPHQQIALQTLLQH